MVHVCDGVVHVCEVRFQSYADDSVNLNFTKNALNQRDGDTSNPERWFCQHWWVA